MIILVIPFLTCRFNSKVRVGFTGTLHNVSSMGPVVLVTFVTCFVVSLPTKCFFKFIVN